MNNRRRRHNNPVEYEFERMNKILKALFIVWGFVFACWIFIQIMMVTS